MAELNSDQNPSTSNKQGSEERQKLISQPKICLTRIDESTLLRTKMPSKSPQKKQLKRLASPIKAASVKKVKNTPKQSSLKNSPLATTVSRPRGRPRKNVEQPGTKSSKVIKKTLKSKQVTSKPTIKTPTKFKKNSEKLSKKSLLQKKSKITIPSAKTKKINEQKVKPSLPTQKKLTSKAVNDLKQTPPKPKLKVLPTKQESSDSSEDEFLYDELIEELENSRNKQMVSKPSISDKKTNITLKPNTGNKPPIIVKGGIVKKTDLPADLKSVASPKLNNSEQVAKNTVMPNERKNKRSSDSIKSPEPTKKPSPWPISISSPGKKIETINKNKTPSSKMQNLQPVEITPKAHPKTLKLGLEEPVIMESTITKIGPKQTAKVTPLSKSYDQDENVSDEYLEEERLECDYDSTEVSAKANHIVKEPTKPVKPAISSADDDPNIDLIRILTDDSDEPVPLEANLKKVTPVKTNPVLESKPVQIHEENHKIIDKPPQQIEKDNSENQAEEEPPLRTIYDLMSEVSLQFPSWNLHIIPENSAFCIAQVTKGRLGLPTLKKCIELDPVNYNAKVYIHQYHIKRFDGVYDSEESILALINEINNIKA